MLAATSERFIALEHADSDRQAEILERLEEIGGRLARLEGRGTTDDAAV
jgi:hypothetical protein